MKRTAIFEITGSSAVTQLLCVDLSSDQSPWQFEQRINERPGISRTIKLLGMEGELTSESLPPVYITFRAKTLEIAQSIALRGAWPHEQPSTLRPSILLLEAHDEIRSVVCQSLEIHNYDVICARSIEEAEMIVQGPTMSVLLLDERTLGENAVLGVQLLKASQRYAKVVLLSESDTSTPRTNVSSVLARGYLQKPFTLQLLLKTLEEVLKTKQSPSSGGGQK